MLHSSTDGIQNIIQQSKINGQGMVRYSVWQTEAFYLQLGEV
jgi:hypothetical protein